MSTRRPILLVIDDEPGMLGLIERVVCQTGFEVRSHASASDALAQSAHQPADAALVDLRMPEIGGLEVLRAIRERDPQCQVILMTGHAWLIAPSRPSSWGPSIT